MTTPKRAPHPAAKESTRPRPIRSPRPKKRRPWSFPRRLPRETGA